VADDVVFLTGVADLRGWIAARPADVTEVWLGFHRVRYGTDPGAVLRFRHAADELAEAGWVPGERRPVDADTYAVRFAEGRVTRRRPPPEWADGPGDMPELSREYDERFRADAAAWAWFEQQPPRYRRTAIWWVMGGKAEATRERRLTALLESSAAGERLAQLLRQM